MLYWRAGGSRRIGKARGLGVFIPCESVSKRGNGRCRGAPYPNDIGPPSREEGNHGGGAPTNGSGTVPDRGSNLRC